MCDRSVHCWDQDRPAHRWKWYSMVAEENSGTTFTKLKFQIKWNMKKHKFSQFHLCRIVNFIKSNPFITIHLSELVLSEGRQFAVINN
jgi:hypothetical protein